MSRKTNYKGWFHVSLPLSDTSANIDWRCFELHQEIEAHDLAKIEIRSRNAEYFDTLHPGTPISVTYQNNFGSQAQFIGYISKISPTSQIENNVFQRDLTCVAADREFRNTARNTWRDRTGPEIVTDIGKRLGFRVVTAQHPLRKKQIVQGGATYWEVLLKLAKMTGYVLRVEGTTLYFLPLKKMVAGFASSAPILADSSVSDVYTVSAVSIDATVGNTSDDDDDTADTAVVVSLGPNDKESFSSREVPESAIRQRRATSSTYEKYNPQVVAHSRADGRWLAKGMADRGMMAYDGHVLSAGDPAIAPYHPVYVATNDPNITGYWIVKRVVHRIRVGEYTCDTTISTDEVSQQRAAPPATRFRDLAQETAQGWSPFVGKQSRLEMLSPSFLSGSTFRSDSRVARWVSV